MPLCIERKDTRIIEILEEVLGITNIEVNSDLRHEFGVDSLDIAQLIYTIEDEFGISFTRDDFDKLTFAKSLSVNELCAIVNKH